MYARRLVLAGLLAGCSAAGPGASAAAMSSCRAAVADHLAKPAGTLEVDWTGTGEDGSGIVLVRDDDGGAGERVHECETDASGRVRAIRHV